MAASLGSLPSSTYAQSTFGGFDGGRLEAPGDLLFDPTAAHVLSDGDNAGDWRWYAILDATGRPFRVHNDRRTHLNHTRGGVS